MTNNSYINRHNDKNIKEFDRTGRFFTRSGQWYFKTREGLDYGPYATRIECRYAYQEFIDVVSSQSELVTAPIDYRSTASDWKIPKINFG